jgi:predicted phosphodiesterase
MSYARGMRVAVLADIHGNLPALTAVLDEVDAAAVDAIVVAGDVVPGPMPGATLERLAQLGDLARYVMGNGDREIVEAFDRPGQEPSGPAMIAWGAAQLERAQRDVLASYLPTVMLDVDGLGATLFCHGSPRSDTEILTSITGPERLGPILEGMAERTIVCGHTHRQFDRRVGDRRLINAGAVGMPYEGDAAAFWALLGPDVELRRTQYDIDAALRTLRAAGAPDVDEMLRESLIEPADPDEVSRHFESLAGSGRG